MGATPGERQRVEGTQTRGTPFPVFVDWILGALVALTGLSAIVGGGMLAIFVDRAALAESIEEEAITVTLGTTELSNAETLDVSEAVVFWTEIGLVVTGLVLVLAAIAFVANRHHAHRQAGPDERVSSFGTVAVIGAVVTAALSFVAISPAIGGALSGYLERGTSGRSVSAGALAGLLPTLPIVAVGLFVLGGLVAGLLAVGEANWAIAVGAAMALALLFVLTVSAALGALGGYVGGKVAGRWGRTG